jgi:uncharacterized radical SAM superfamily protein
MTIFDVHLIKPTRYDDEGYPLQWWRSTIPSNSLACVAGLVREAIARGALGEGVEPRVHIVDEIHSKVDPERLVAEFRRHRRPTVVFLVGVQTNQFPRAVDLARPLRAAGIPVAIGGFHVSGCMAMLKDMPPDLVEAQELGISFFLGEAEEGRIDVVLRDGYAGRLQPIYDHLKATPGLGGAPTPFLDAEEIRRNITRFASLDLGRGCPFECSFCTIINVQGRKSRFRTPDDLEAIVRENAAHGIDRFFVTDDNFARNKNWESFADRLIALRKQGFKVRMAIQVDALAHKIPDFIDKMCAAGADQIFIGLENINSDNLESVKKRQNRIEDYRATMLAWKKHSVIIICGYIIGFPFDTRESVKRDMETLKRELAIDVIFLNFLTPLPGSEDHARLTREGIWMDPDMNRYDINHRVTHHTKMSDEEWEAAHREAHEAFYDWDHMRTVIRRLAALRSTKRKSTVLRLTIYREAQRLEGVAALEGGLLRIRRRRQRRPGLPVENPIVFYPRHWWRVARATSGMFFTWYRLTRFLKRTLADPNRFDYSDVAIRPEAEAEAQTRLLAATRATTTSERRQKRAAEASERRRDAV